MPIGPGICNTLRLITKIKLPDSTIEPGVFNFLTFLFIFLQQLYMHQK
jgi:hypothetical protein